MNDKLGKEWISSILINIGILLLGLWAMQDLLHPDFGLYASHDSNSHLERLVQFTQAFQDGQWLPRWGQGFFQGIGSPVLLLNYQLPYFLSLIFFYLGFSLFSSFKLVVAFSFILSALLFYYAFKPTFGSIAACTGAVLYAWAPYRFVDIYIRGAFGENVSFLFPPLIWWGYRKKSLWLTSIGFAGLFLSHPVGSMLFLGFFYLLSLSSTIQKKSLASQWLIIVSSFLGLGLASFNLFPTLHLTAFTHYSPANSQPYFHFPSLSQLIASPWIFDYSQKGVVHKEMSYELGKAHWLILLLAVSIGMTLIIQYVKNQKTSLPKTWPLLLISLLVTVLGIWFMNQSSLVAWQILNLNRFLDFPWRILMVVVWSLAILGTYIIAFLPKKIRGIIAIATILLAISSTQHYNHVIRWFRWDITRYQINPGSGDAWGEYTSIYRKTRTDVALPRRLQIVEGSGIIQMLENKTHYLHAKVKIISPSKLRFNIMHFPGWEYTMNQKKIDPFSHPCRITFEGDKKFDISGLVECAVLPGEYEAAAYFSMPTSQRIGVVFSLMSLGCLGIFTCGKYLKPIISTGKKNKNMLPLAGHNYHKKSK